MDFAKLAAAQAALRQAAAGVEKTALVQGIFGALGRAGMWGGRKAMQVGGWAAQHPLKAIMGGMGVMAGASEIKGGVNKYRNAQAGFRPEVQAYQSQPQPPQVPQP
jgi:hypothetical protein